MSGRTQQLMQLQSQKKLLINIAKSKPEEKETTTIHEMLEVKIS